jgi:hypothetical protein
MSHMHLYEYVYADDDHIVIHMHLVIRKIWLQEKKNPRTEIVSNPGYQELPVGYQMRIREGLNFRIRFWVEEKSKVDTKKLGFVDTSEKKRINRHTPSVRKYKMF